MSKHKQSPRSRHHKNIVGGILAAALALTIVVAAQLGGADTSQFAADMASDCFMAGGSWSASTNFCQMPGGVYTAPVTDCASMGAGYWWNGTSCQSPAAAPITNYTAPTMDTAQMQAGCVAGGGTWMGISAMPSCQMPTYTSGSSNCGAGFYWNGTACVSNTSTATTCSGGQYWNGNACVSSTTGTSCPSGQWWVSAMNSCQSSTATVCPSGQWMCGNGQCSVNNVCPTSGTTSSCGAGYWWNGTSCQINSAAAAYPVGTCANGTAYPAGTGMPPCGYATGTTQYGTAYSAGNCNGVAYPAGTGTPPCGSTTGGNQYGPSPEETACMTKPLSWWDYSTKACKTMSATEIETMKKGCLNAQGAVWDPTAVPPAPTCKMPNATTWPITTYPVETVDNCKNKGGTWNASSSTCTWPSYNTDTQWNNDMQPYDTTTDKYGFNNIMPMYQGFGPQGMSGQQAPMPFGPGMQNGFFTDGNFAPPTWDAQQLTEQYSEYGFDQNNYEFDKYQIDWNQEYQGPQMKAQDRTRELKRIQKDGNRQSREIAQFEKELENAKGRSGGNNACPAIANASAGLSNAKAVVELMTGATEDTLEQAMNAQGQLYGNKETQGIWNDVMQAVQGSHQCEQLSQMQKDGGREVKQMTKESSRVKDAETKAFLQSVLTEFSNVVNNLGDYYQPCDGGYGPCDPMEEARYAMDDLRMKFWDTMREQQDQFQYDDVCSNFDMIREELSAADDIPEFVLAKVSGLLNRGVAYCADGNIDGARKILGEMDRMKREFEGRGDFEGGMEFGRDAQDYMRDAAELEFSDGELDIDALMARMEELFLSKMESAVQAAVDRVTQQFALKIAQMESKFADILAASQVASLDNISKFNSAVRDTILESKTEVADAVADFDTVLVAFEGENIEIPAAVQAQIQDIYEFATVRNLTEDASQELKAEIDAVTNQVVIAFQENPEAAVELLVEFVPVLA